MLTDMCQHCILIVTCHTDGTAASLCAYHLEQCTYSLSTKNGMFGKDAQEDQWDWVGVDTKQEKTQVKGGEDDPRTARQEAREREEEEQGCRSRIDTLHERHILESRPRALDCASKWAS